MKYRIELGLVGSIPTCSSTIAPRLRIPVAQGGHPQESDVAAAPGHELQELSVPVVIANEWYGDRIGRGIVAAGCRRQLAGQDNADCQHQA
jgi:hypothetical protein